MMLRKSEKEDLKKAIRDYLNGTAPNISLSDYGYLWRRLSYNHFQTTYRDIKHIADISTIEALEAAIIDGSTLFILPNYIKYYTNAELDLIESQAKRARQSLTYIESAIRKERTARTGPGARARVLKMKARQ